MRSCKMPKPLQIAAKMEPPSRHLETAESPRGRIVERVAHFCVSRQDAIISKMRCDHAKSRNVDRGAQKWTEDSMRTFGGLLEGPESSRGLLIFELRDKMRSCEEPQVL